MAATMDFKYPSFEKKDVDFYGEVDVFNYNYVELYHVVDQDLDGNAAEAVGSIHVAEKDPKKDFDYGKDYYYKVDKEGLDVEVSELITDTTAIEGIASAALTKATLLTDDHLTSGYSAAEALGHNTLAKTAVDIDVTDEYVNVGGFSISGAEGKAAPAPAEEHHYF